MSEKKNSKFYNRNFLLLLYPDNEKHIKALDTVIRLYSDYAFILHNKDEYLENQDIECVEIDELLDSHILKKEHYHVVIKFQNARYRSSVAKELEIEERFVRTANLDASLLYLIHFDDEDKFQYSLDDVQGNLKLRLQKLIKNRGKDEDAKVLDLINYIETATTTLTVTSFAKWCAENGLWDIYRRGASIFNQCIKEHNSSLGILANKAGFEQLAVADILKALANYY